jgi:hypothetical protein
VWAYPRWADRLTPHLAIEGPAHKIDIPSGQVDALPADNLVGAAGHASAAPDRR